ncbi:MAG: hypothetical protein VZR27_05000 [Acutalibacteraceae bacterium]|nr:hypothetical protein [Clostridia bacterium]MEE3450043.1 hypothetical protein [Acutalibacteraceae bacterium]
MPAEKGVGVFATVNTLEKEQSGESARVDLVSVPENYPDTIYNLIFREFDEENQ